jgi:hypothetical protein
MMWDSLQNWFQDSIIDGTIKFIQGLGPIVYYGCEISALIFFIFYFCTHEKKYKSKCIVAVLIYLIYKAVTL